MTQKTDLSVTSHVGRDLLASAALFKNEAAAAWEYVVNSLQYVDPGIAPRVQVIVKPRLKAIEIHDNGSGMDADRLNHFFQMHGENVERREGRPGRGKFGTGKAAAFGIGAQLRVETRRNGTTNVVELTRAAIDASGGDEIPIDWLVKSEDTERPNGTTIVISEIFLPRINTSSIVEYVERHLQACRAYNPEVAVNDHVCSYREPEVAESLGFEPSDEQAEAIGHVQLTIKVARAPLPEAEQGVFVTAGPGNAVAVERAGIDRKDYGNYLFGEVDVPKLEEGDTPIEPYDSSRSLALNPNHPTAAVLVGFIGSKLEQVRLRLVRADREARKSEQARRLAEEADKIAGVLNDDFEVIRRRLEDIRAASASTGKVPASFGDAGAGGEEDDAWVQGSQEPGDVEKGTGTGAEGAGTGRPPPKIVTSGHPNLDGTSSVDRAGGRSTRKKKPTGGFKVEYKRLGKDYLRSDYDKDRLAILINLDHPVVAAALGDGNVKDMAFRRLSYEVAFSEYAMALGYVMLGQDPDMPPDDLLYEVRASLNRISSRAASLYR
jgi:hypothetical protein